MKEVYFLVLQLKQIKMKYLEMICVMSADSLKYTIDFLKTRVRFMLITEFEDHSKLF